MSKLTNRYLDSWSTIVVVLTLISFIVALMVHGFTHDLLLEVGVFLVSAKLVLMAYKNSVVSKKMEDRLEGIQDSLRRIENSKRSQ